MAEPRTLAAKFEIGEEVFVYNIKSRITERIFSMGDPTTGRESGWFYHGEHIENGIPDPWGTIFAGQKWNCNEAGISRERKVCG